MESTIIRDENGAPVITVTGDPNLFDVYKRVTREWIQSGRPLDPNRVIVLLKDYYPTSSTVFQKYTGPWDAVIGSENPKRLQSEDFPSIPADSTCTAVSAQVVTSDEALNIALECTNWVSFSANDPYALFENAPSEKFKFSPRFLKEEEGSTGWDADEEFKLDPRWLKGKRSTDKAVSRIPVIDIVDPSFYTRLTHEQKKDSIKTQHWHLFETNTIMCCEGRTYLISNLPSEKLQFFRSMYKMSGTGVAGKSNLLNNDRAKDNYGDAKKLLLDRRLALMRGKQLRTFHGGSVSTFLSGEEQDEGEIAERGNLAETLFQIRNMVLAELREAVGTTPSAAKRRRRDDGADGGGAGGYGGSDNPVDLTHLGGAKKRTTKRRSSSKGKKTAKRLRSISKGRKRSNSKRRR
jgi:hypothetical protein